MTTTIKRSNIANNSIKPAVFDTSTFYGLNAAQVASVVAISANVAAETVNTFVTLQTSQISNTAPAISTVTLTDASYNPIDDIAANTNGSYLEITGINFQPGAIVMIGSSNTALSTTYVNSTTLRAQLPAISSGTYPLYVINTNGGTGIKINGLTTSSFPAWNTSATLANAISNVAFSYTLSANSDSNITYSNTTILPTNTTLLSNGYFYGNVSISSDTSYSFGVKATDAENQDVSRTFSLTVANVPPANITSSSTNVTKSGNILTATYIGSVQTFTVSGYPTITINAWGGGGGGANPAAGGGAAGGTYTFLGSPGDTIQVYIGGGGNGASTGAGGGGATLIYKNSSTLLMVLGGGGGGATAGSDPGKGASDSTSGVSGSNKSNAGTGGNGGGGGVDAGGGAGILSNGGAGGHTSTVAQRNNPYGDGGTGSGGTGGKGGGGNGSAGGDGGGGGGGGGYSGGGGGGSGFNASGGGGGGSYINTDIGSGTLYGGSGRTVGGTGLTGYTGSYGYGGTSGAQSGNNGYVYITYI